MLLDALFGRSRLSTHGSGDILERWLTQGLWGGGKTKAGVAVSEDTALTLAAWWCGCRILCEAVSGLPFLTYRRQGEDRKTASDHWLFDLLWRSPNPDMPSGPWREGRVLHQIGYGNGFSEIEWDSDIPELRSRAVALWPIHASRVRAVANGGAYASLYQRGFRYLVRNDDGSDMPLKADEMLHVPGVFPEDGIWGKSAVTYHRESIGFGLAIERYGSAFFGSGGQPRGVVEGLGLKSKDARDEYRRQWRELHGDPDSAEIAILPDGSKFTLLTHMTNENAQFLESRKFSVAQIARILRLPVHMLEETQGTASYASVELRSIDFIVYSLMPWIRRWEDQCNLKLLALGTDRDNLFVEFLLAGLLRGDFKSRMDGYVQALMNGIMTLNEVRRLENLNTIGPAGDVNYVAMNLTTAERMLAGPPEKATLPNNDGAQDADQFTREMLAKLQQQSRKLLRRAKKSKAALQLGHDKAASPVALRGARAVLVDVLGRMFGKESNAAARAVNARGDFDSWLAEFYGKHETLLAEALAPAAEVLASLGKPADTKAMAAELSAESKAMLRDGYDRQTKAQFLAALEAWPTERAAAKADVILARSVEAGGGLVQIVTNRSETHHHTHVENKLPVQSLTVQANMPAAPAVTVPVTVQAAEPAPQQQVTVVNEITVQPSPPTPIEVMPSTVVNENKVEVHAPKIESVEQEIQRDRDGDMSRTVSKYRYEDDQ